MQLSKKIILIFFSVYLMNTLNAQPGPTKYHLRGNFAFIDCNKNEIPFETEDSITFFSKQEDYSFKIYELVETSDKEKKKYFLKLNDHESPDLFIQRNNVFFLSCVIQMNINRVVVSGKIKTVFEIEKKRKKMFICFDFGYCGRDVDLGNFDIYFQEGTFEVNDPKNPKLYFSPNSFVQCTNKIIAHFYTVRSIIAVKEDDL